MTTNFKNQTKYNRSMHNEDNTYTLVSDLLIKDKRLSIIEKGIMVSILSNDDSYIFNSTYFKKDLGIGDDKYNKAIANLITCGYIVKNKVQGGIQWIFNEAGDKQKNTPSEFIKSTPCENTLSENIKNTPKCEATIDAVNDAVNEEEVVEVKKTPKPIVEDNEEGEIKDEDFDKYIHTKFKVLIDEAIHREAKLENINEPMKIIKFKYVIIEKIAEKEGLVYSELADKDKRKIEIRDEVVRIMNRYKNKEIKIEDLQLIKDSIKQFKKENN